MSQELAFHEVARLADPQDNVAIATQRLESGSRLSYEGQHLQLNSTILEGHRFAIKDIAVGQPLLSWGLPFGLAIKAIKPAEYVANESILSTLKARDLVLELPEEANFEDSIKPYMLDEAKFQAAEQLSLYTEQLSFEGYKRSGKRGVGTRNTIILLGTSSLTGSFVKALEAKFKDKTYTNIDGIVAIAHTEGGSKTPPNNYELVLRTLAGFMVHPNVAAVLSVDYGTEIINNQVLEAYMHKHDFPLSEVPHAFMSLKQDINTDLEQAESIVTEWLESASQCQRETVSLAHLNIALQCGGSDAFSGISGNPLAGYVAKQVIRYGGSANLAETDELIGAEAYVLQKVKNLKVARKFLTTIERFKARAAWHGSSAEGNPSGGNKLRGLYNIVLKSIGAANKKDPEVRLDDVLEYGERNKAPGFFFMDSPGNDLESIAGQVASGCNMIFFVTGNGSITNFPFVPTLKFVTTTERFELLKNDMDVNAGAYLDGKAMEDLGQETLDLCRKVASGEKTVGEKAQHSQVQLWRNWQQQNKTGLAKLLNAEKPSGKPISLTIQDEQQLNETLELALNAPTEQLALILPTSLCSGQIAQKIAQALNQTHQDINVVALSHTEGCGVSGGPTSTMQTETLINYLRHPFIKHALLLEHGCEKTHNDYMSNVLLELGMNKDQFGWASIQLDGGIDKVSKKVRAYFEQKLQTKLENDSRQTPLKISLAASHELPQFVARAYADLTKLIVSSGGSVILPESALTRQTEFIKALGLDALEATLAYGQFVSQEGLHVMQSPTDHWVETMTGLGATGTELMVTHIHEHLLQTHPFIPVLQVCSDAALSARYSSLDALLNNETASTELLDLIVATLSKQNQPKLAHELAADFQMTRGQLGISM